MHLTYSTSRYKGNSYKSYSIARSYRDGKKVKKTILWALGKLSEIQAQQIKLICKVAKSEKQIVTRLEDIVVEETKAYLDLAVVNDLWDLWELDKAFDVDVTTGSLPTNVLARILTINRCTDPCSHYSVPEWARKNALEQVLEISLSGLNDDKIYYELDKIHKNKISIENHLFNYTYKKSPESFGFINYDLTTSYFVGYKCNISAFGKGKIECQGRRQVLLGVLINDEGYPFKWDVFPGNTAEVKTLKRNINACKTRFKLNNKNVTLVFDRGIISDENGEFIADADMKYISALNRNQIPACGISLKPFNGLSTAASPSITTPEGFRKYDDELSFHDNGIIGKKRYITGFNPTLFKEDRKNREEKIVYFKKYLKEENKKLSRAKKDRQLDATKSRILNELRRLKVQKYFSAPILTPISIRKKLESGLVKSVNSFKVNIKKKNDVIRSDQLLDGVWVLITNHTEKQGRGFKLPPKNIIKAYRDKTKIEDVFKNIKSFLKIRPFFVNTEAHVKAVYTICILAYCLNKYVANQRKKVCGKDFLNSKELYAPFKDIDIATLKDKNTGETLKKAVTIPEETKRLLEKIKLSHVAINQEE